MLIQGTSLLNRPVMSLQTGTEIARTNQFVVDPRTLFIVGFSLEGRLLEVPGLALMTRDIREISSLGLIVDSSDELVLPKDIISFQTVIEFDFQLVGIKVVDQKKRTLGKVSDFTINPLNYQIEQIRIKRPFLKSLNDTELLISRSQIVEVQNGLIIVKSEKNETPQPILTEQRSFANPFRSTSTSAQPESSTTR